MPAIAPRVATVVVFYFSLGTKPPNPKHRQWFFRLDCPLSLLLVATVVAVVFLAFAAIVQWLLQ